MSDIRQWLDQTKGRGMKLGLERVHAAHKSLIQSYKSTIIHVAGSNGKGTACALMATHLHRLNKTTVMFTSPHLVRLEERIRIDGKPISEQQFDIYLSLIQQTEIDLNIELTFFETTFLASCLCARDINPDVFIVETGLGGRFDATRILPADLCLLTSIQLEHRDILGNTLAEIAAEKAAIARDRIKALTQIQSSQKINQTNLNEADVISVYKDSGKIPTKLVASEWAKEVENLGAGEIFLNSVDRDGSKEGYDIRLLKSVADNVNIPVIACGGVGKNSHFSEAIISANCSAVSAANIFQHTEHSTISAKAMLLKNGVEVRLNGSVKYSNFEFDHFELI